MAVCKCRLGICEITTVSLLKVAIESIGRVNIEYRIISSKTLSRGTPIWILRNWMVDRCLDELGSAIFKIRHNEVVQLVWKFRIYRADPMFRSFPFLT